jgi:hypothetical protein
MRVTVRQSHVMLQIFNMHQGVMWLRVHTAHAAHTGWDARPTHHGSTSCTCIAAAARPLPLPPTCASRAHRPLATSRLPE